MLIPCDRHTAADLATWRRLEAQDALHWRTHRRRLARMAGRSAAFIREFAAVGSCYTGVSWGKDSVVLAHVAALAGIMVPWVHVLAPGCETPYTAAVRDPFLSAHPPPMEYVEIAVQAPADGGAMGRHDAGYAEASRRFGDRYVSGVRADESYARTMRLQGHGVSTARTCAPLSHWKGADVFAWCHAHELPLHPSYGMTAGGRFDRAQLRVSSVGHLRGVTRGQREWEMIYYRDVLEMQGLDTRRV